MLRYTCGCKCIERHLKGTVLWGIITWSEMGKQNIQAKKVCFIILGTVVHYTLFLYIYFQKFTIIFNKLVLNLLLGADPENSEKGGQDTKYLFTLLIFFKNNRTYHRKRWGAPYHRPHP